MIDFIIRYYITFARSLKVLFLLESANEKRKGTGNKLKLHTNIEGKNKGKNLCILSGREKGQTNLLNDRNSKI